MDEKLTREMLELLRSRYYGKYRGLVVSNDLDPTRRGRIEVTVPAVLGDQKVWAMPCVPYAGKDVGFHMLPPVGGGVWVEFEAGDPSYPIWSGCYWAADDIAADDARAAVKFIRTDKLTLRIDDAKGEMVIETATGARITVSPLAIKLEAIEVESIAKTRSVKVTPARVSINDGVQEVV